jgi:hypothetical protein
MLIEFRVENHRSIRDEQVISFEASGAADDRVRQVPGHPTGLLPALAIYGANASGKSNVLAALAFMREAVVNSQRTWSPDGPIPRDPFAWGDPRPSLYELTFLLDGVRYQYGFVVDDTRVIEEWVHAWPRGRKQVWFAREADRFRFSDHMEGQPEKIQAFGRPNALFLSTAAQSGHAQLTPIYGYLGRLTFPQPNMDLLASRSGMRVLQAAGLTATELLRAMGWFRTLQGGSSQSQELDLLRSLVRTADVGITDVRQASAETGLEFEHAGWHWLPLAQESHGTQKLVSLAKQLSSTLQAGSAWIIDELESGLHPALCLFLLRQFNGPKTNPNNAQLLFTTHDTHLLGTTLGEPPLRRDQVWLTEKDAEGATHLLQLRARPRHAL